MKRSFETTPVAVEQRTAPADAPHQPAYLTTRQAMDRGLIPSPTLNAAYMWLQRRGIKRCADGTIRLTDLLLAKRQKRGQRVVSERSLANLRAPRLSVPEGR